MVTTTCNQNDGEVTLTWKQPDRNGAAITRYKVYQKKGSEKNWMEITTIENNSNSTHKYVVRNLEKDKVYLFLVTATNEYGESLKKGYCKGVIVREGRYKVTLKNIVLCEVSMRWIKIPYSTIACILYYSLHKISFELFVQPQILWWRGAC